jgi:protein ImuB
LAARPEVPPIVVAGKRDNALRLTALDEPASRAGLSRGQGLSDARAMAPAIEIVTEDRTADLLLLEALANWCDRYTPLVALDVPDGLMLDITGCAGLFGGEKPLMDDLLARLFHQGFAANAAIAATSGAAWALARFSPSGSPARRHNIVATAETGPALAPLPLAALRLDEETLSGLARIGLHFVGQIMSRPRAPLARRFGRRLLLRLDQALGAADEAISPRLPVPALSAERRLAEPIVSVEAIETLILRLAGHIGARMEERGLGARLVDLALFRADGEVFRLGIGASRPLRDAADVLRLFRERLAALQQEFDPGCGFDMLRLSVCDAETMPEAEIGLFAGEADPRPVLDLIDRLGARLGFANVLASLPQDSHLPEESERLIGADAASPQFHTTRKSDLSGRRASGPDEEAAPPLRPVRLFPTPEPVEVVAEVPDGPPRLIRWRRTLREIRRAEGPERIADEWWHGRQTRMTRDYFRVEDEEGRRYWLFRLGLYGRETSRPRWFMHGLFA